MKINYSRICACLIPLALNFSADGQSNFTVTPGLAFQASFPALESYQYQVFYSSNLSSWFPASGLVTSPGGRQTMTFGMTNGPSVFYRVQQSFPNLTNRIVGLTNVYFDNAVFSASGPAITLAGFRANSRDYNSNDYLTGNFLFDIHSQTFSLTNLQAYTNVGLICGQSPQYFITDATNQLTMTNTAGMTLLTPDVAHSISTTGQVLTINLKAAQVFSMDVSSLSVNIKVLLTDPTGKLLINDIWQTGYSWYSGGNGGLIAGAYSLQLIPQGTTNTTLTLTYHNCNGKALTTMTNGQNISTSLANFSGDYSKFKVSMNAGQTLQLSEPGIGAELDVFNSLGVKVYNRGGDGCLFFTAPSNDTYYVIYDHTDLGTTHSYSSTVSITP